MSKDATDYLAAYLLMEGAAMTASGDDGITSDGIAFKEEWREAVANATVIAMRSLIEEHSGWFIPSKKLKEAIEEVSGEKAPGTGAFSNLISRLFPVAKYVRQYRFESKTVAGCQNIGFIEDCDNDAGESQKFN